MVSVAALMPASGTWMHYLLLVASVGVTVTLAGIGLRMWETSVFMSSTATGGWGNGHPFTGENLAGIILFIFFCAAAVVSVYTVVSAALHQAITMTSLKAPNGSTRYGLGEATESNPLASADNSAVGESTPSRLCDVSPRVCLYAATILYAGCSLAFLIIGVIAGATWARDPLFTCGVVFCIGDPSSFPPSTTRPTIGLSFNALFGMMAFFTLVPIGLIMAWRLISLRGVLLRSSQSAADASSEPSSGVAPRRGKPTGTTAVYDLYAGVVPIVVFLCLTALVGFYLPNDARRFIASGIAQIARLRATYGSITGTDIAPELPVAWFRTRNMVLGEYLTLKLYPSNMFFYGYVLLVILSMYLLRLTVLGRTWLRAPVKWLPRRGWNYSDLLLSCLTLLFSGLFFFYWVHDHNYRHIWSSSMGDDSTGYLQSSELWGRAMGQLAVFFLSLLMFPASRSSSLPLFRAMGLSWDSFLWAHRVLGYAMLLAVLAHVVCFLVTFSVNGVLKWNFTSLPPVLGQSRVRSDFTVYPVAAAMIAVFLSMGVFAFHTLRRRCFELFYYSHLLSAYILFPVVLWHSASGWEYLLPGLTLWLLDRFIRLYRSGAPVEVLACRTIDAQTSRIDFRFSGSSAAVGSGYYIFLNIPEMALLEWHPFSTIATSAIEGVAAADSGGDGRLSVFVKAMPGEAAWTRRLYDRIAAATPEPVPASPSANKKAARGGAASDYANTAPQVASPAPARPPISLRADGPCGSGLGTRDVGDYDSVYLVAGGIGIVPCAALYQSLFDQHGKRSEAARVSPFPSVVRLLWVCRSRALVEAFAHVLACKSEGDGEHASAFGCRVFLTGDSTDGDAFLNASPVSAVAVEEGGAFPGTGQRDCARGAREGDGGLAEGGGNHCCGRGREDDAESELPSISDLGLPADLPPPPPPRRTPCVRGRPDWLREFTTTPGGEAPEVGGEVAEQEHPRGRVLVVACGPSPLMREVRDIAVCLGATFYQEEFEL